MRHQTVRGLLPSGAGTGASVLVIGLALAWPPAAAAASPVSSAVAWQVGAVARLAADRQAATAVLLPTTGERVRWSGQRRDQRIEVTGSLGFATFIDEDFIEHVTVGGAVRWPLSSRWSLEPRFNYMRGGPRDQDFFLLGSAIYDLRPAAPVTPYLVVGGGFVWHRAKFGAFDEITFVSHGEHFSGGAGVRVKLSERWSLVSEARLGYEPLFQVHGGLAYGF